MIDLQISDNWQLDLYNEIYRIIRINFVDIKDQEDMVNDVYLDILNYYIKNKDKYYIKYHLPWMIKRSCEKWVRKQRTISDREISLEAINVLYRLDEEYILKKNICDVILEKAQLDSTDKYIMYLYFVEEYTYGEIGEKIHKSRERVSQHIAKSLRKCRNSCYYLQLTKF